MDELVLTVRRWSARARMQRSVRWVFFGLACGLGLALIAALAARVWPLLSVPQLLLISGVCSATGVLAATATPWLREVRTTPLRWARTFDQRFGLQQRVSTALELYHGEIFSRNDDLQRRQLDDALRVAARINAPRLLPLQISLRDAAVAAALLAALLLAVFLPNQQQDVLANAAIVAEQKDQGAQSLDDLQRAVQGSDLLDDETKAQALQALQDAEDTLRNPNTSAEEAMAALNEAQAKLNDLSQQAADEKLAELQRAGQNMSPDELTNSLADALANREFEKAAQQLRELTNKDNSQLNAEEQQRIANQLEQMSRDLKSTDDQLAQQLRDAAQNLREGNSSDAGQKLSQAAAALDKAAQSESAVDELSQTQSGVNEARRQLASASGQSQQGNQPGDPSQNPGQGQSGQPASGGDPGNASGQPGNGQNGQNAAQSQHSEDTGSSNEVWAPQRVTGDGQVVDLPQNQARNAPNPSGKPSAASANTSSVPYQQVYSNYAKTADEAIQNGEVPAELRDYVRDYFSSLNPRQTR